MSSPTAGAAPDQDSSDANSGAAAAQSQRTPKSERTREQIVAAA
ncbi:MAG: hypothetical protein QOG96_1513, partial [Pseudonocardiales bacterium]|nr:hypothetical protein [Pseudonocardiales bacterium]